MQPPEPGPPVKRLTLRFDCRRRADIADVLAQEFDAGSGGLARDRGHTPVDIGSDPAVRAVCARSAWSNMDGHRP